MTPTGGEGTAVHVQFIATLAFTVFVLAKGRKVERRQASLLSIT